MIAPKDKMWIQKIVCGALRGAINAHGPITKDLVGSAGKRISGSIYGEIQKRIEKDNLTH
jgi:hypothetical protein